MKKLFQFSILTILLLLPSYLVKAQDTDEKDSIPMVLEKIQSDLSVFSKIKISGYLQAQYQSIDSAGAKGFSGGDFDAGIDNRFMIRRGRLKIAYTNNLSQYVIQLDANEKDGVSVKDIYMKFTDPWTNAFTFTGGLFNRPFGYEIEYSSSQRESPERARIYQTLFSGERDLGACLTFQPRKSSPYNFLKIDLGLFNGINKKDFDNKKDFIGRITLNKLFFSENLKVGIGASYYDGSVVNDTFKMYKMDGEVFVVDKPRISANSYSDRIYKGIEMQLAYSGPIGISQLRGEYLWGTSSGTKSSTKLIDKKLAEDIYIRPFSGWYILFSQNIAQLPVQLVAKYDVYDPNTKVTDDKIGAVGSFTNAGDIKYSTLGLGLIYRWDSNIKITAYYDMVTNEETKVSKYYTDLQDNAFTLRIQYKF